MYYLVYIYIIVSPKLFDHICNILYVMLQHLVVKLEPENITQKYISISS